MASTAEALQSVVEIIVVTRAEIEASAYHKQAIADYEALIRQLSCNAFVK